MNLSQPLLHPDNQENVNNNNQCTTMYTYIYIYIKDSSVEKFIIREMNGTPIGCQSAVYYVVESRVGRV